MTTIEELRERFDLPFCDAAAAARAYNDSLGTGKPVTMTVQASTPVLDVKSAERAAHEAEWRKIVSEKFHRTV